MLSFFAQQLLNRGVCTFVFILEKKKKSLTYDFYVRPWTANNNNRPLPSSTPGYPWRDS